MMSNIQPTQYETRFHSQTWGNKPFFQAKVTLMGGGPNEGKWKAFLVQGGVKTLQEKFFDNCADAISFAETLVPENAVFNTGTVYD